MGTDDRQFTAEDFARQVLDRYDSGGFSDPVAMAGHLAAALRMMLDGTRPGT
jgi:hypothetical protein